MKRVIDNLYTRGGGNAQERISELKRVLGLGTAAYTAITAYIGHTLATAANDFLVASGSGTFVKKTVEETRAIINKVYLTQESVSSGLSETELDIDTFCSQLATDSGGDTFVLPDGNVTGQMKKLIFRTNGGDSVGDGYAVVEASMGSDRGTITFDYAGQYVLLYWNGTEWVTIEYGNTAEPGNDPTFSS